MADLRVDLREGAVRESSSVTLAADVRRLLAARPEIAVKLLGELAARLRAANERITRQSFQTVAGRVASVLIGQVEARIREGADERDGAAVWQALLERSVLVRDCSSWPRLDGCLRVTIGTPTEDDAFLTALEEALT